MGDFLFVHCTAETKMSVLGVGMISGIINQPSRKPLKLANLSARTVFMATINYKTGLATLHCRPAQMILFTIFFVRTVLLLNCLI